jgi:hypothetical protein
MNKNNEKLKVGDIVSVNYGHDDSGYTSDKYGVEPQNSRFEKVFYIENDKFVIIYVNRNRSVVLAQRIIQSRDLQRDDNYVRTDHIINISKNARKGEINYILDVMECWDLSWDEILGDDLQDVRTLENYIDDYKTLEDIINNIEILDKKEIKLYL